MIDLKTALSFFLDNANKEYLTNPNIGPNILADFYFYLQKRYSINYPWTETLTKERQIEMADYFISKSKLNKKEEIILKRLIDII